MNRIALLCVALAVVSIASLGVAQNASQPASTGAPRIAVLDVVRVFSETAQIRDLNDKIRQLTEEYTKEAAQRRKSIEDKQMELTAFQPGSSDYQARRKALVRANIDANVWLKVAEQSIDQLKFDWTRVIYEKAAAEASAIAQEQGYQLVLQRSDFKPYESEQSVQVLRRMISDRAVIYSVPQLDITDSVIHRLDAAYRSSGGRKQLGGSDSAMDK